MTRGSENDGFDLPKGDKTRKVPVTTPLRAALEDQRQLTGLGKYVFLNQYGVHYKSQDKLNSKFFKPLMERTGLKMGTIHDMRASFITMMLQNGMSIELLIQIVGHADFEVLRNHYLGELKIDESVKERIAMKFA